MVYKSKTKTEDAALRESLQLVCAGLGVDLIELTVFRRRGNAQARVVIRKKGGTGVEDCSRVHRALLPRLEPAFGGRDFSVEVSSPGVGRLIKDGAEFAFHLGRPVRCYRADIRGWTEGTLRSSDENGIVLYVDGGEVTIPYGVIAKARLLEE